MLEAVEMRQMTRAEVRDAVVNLDPGQKRLHLPVWFDDIDWDRRVYLGWRDLRAPKRVYIIADVDGRARGLTLRQNPNQAVHGARAVMCDLCRFARRFNEVSLFAAPRPSTDKRQRLSTVGLHVCTDLDCSVNVNATPHLGPLDPPAEEIIARRRAGLHDRTVAFLRSVSDVDRTRTR